MKNRNLMIGTAAGVAILGATAWYLSKKGKLDWRGMLNTAGNTISGITSTLESLSEESIADHGGSKLADKVKAKAGQIASQLNT